MFWEWFFLPLMAIALVIAMLALQEVGRWRARRYQLQGDSDTKDGTSAIDATVFALLGLLLAFQFSSAASRLDGRRSVLIEEANAIGTAYLRIDLLPPAEQPPLRDLYREYVDARIAAYHALPDFAGFQAQQQRALALQTKIWSLTVHTSAQVTTPGVNLLVIEPVNDMIDLSTVRDAAMLTHGSPVIGLFLIGVCLLAALVAGQAMAASEHRPLFHMFILAMLVSTTVYVIFDLEYPRIGLLRIGVADQVMTDLRTSLR